MGACCGKLPEAAEFLQSFEAPPTRCLGAPKSEQLIFVMPEKFLSLSGQHVLMIALVAIKDRVAEQQALDTQAAEKEAFEAVQVLRIGL